MTFDASLYALTNALQPVRRAWVQAATQQLAGAGLSISLATVVLFVSRLGAAPHQKALALEVGVNPAALVRLLDQGEAAGLMVRKEAKGDRRSKVIELLPEGKRLAHSMEESLARLRLEMLGNLPVEDVETATRVLRLLEERVAARLRDNQDR